MNGNLEKQARYRWRNGKWELWYPNVLPEGDECAPTAASSEQKIALAGMAELSEDGGAPERVTPWVLYPDSQHAFEGVGERVVEEGERVWVDEFGTDFEVGNPEDTYTAFTSGGCHIFAAVAHAETGWPVVAYGYKECVNGCSPDTHYDASEGENGEWSGTWCDCHMSHFYVRDPNGRIWDVTSCTDEEAILDDMDEFAVRDVPDEVFSVALTAWGSSPDLVGWARKHVVESNFGNYDYSLYE
jgi:hypothetical protein